MLLLILICLRLGLNTRSSHVAYTADQEADAIDAFQLAWRMYSFYAIPLSVLLIKSFKK